MYPRTKIFDRPILVALSVTRNQKRPYSFYCRALYFLAPRDGLEPPT